MVTMDDASSKIYSAFLVEEEGTASTFNWHRQRWSNMAQFGSFTSPPVARRGTKRSPAAWLSVCLASQGGQATTGQIAEWCRPEIVYAGGKPTAPDCQARSGAVLDRRAEGPAGGGNGRAVSDNRTGKQTTSLSRRWHGDLVSGSASKVETMESTD